VPPEGMGSMIHNQGFGSFVEAIQQAERLGFQSFFLPDHFMYAKNNILYEAWTVLAALASKTETIRIGTCVSPIPFYNPSILAKRVSTLDHISRGRVIFGAGCGWYDKEFKAYGIPFDPFHTRICKMLEGIELVKALWTTDGPVDYHGKYYHLKDAELLPKPIQKPHPPIWFGGSSTQILKAVAKHGQGWIPGVEPPREFKAKAESIFMFAKEEGRDPAKIVLALALRTIVASTRNEVKKILRSLLLTQEVREKMFIGTPTEIAAKIREYIKLGISHFRLGIQPTYRIMESLQLYKREIIPQI